MATTKYYLCAANGFAAPFRAKIHNAAIDYRGGGDLSFPIELQVVGGGGQPWWGSVWTMDATMFSSLLALAVEAKPGVRINDGGPATDLAWYEHSEFSGGALDYRSAWLQALADTVRKPNDLEEVNS